ncbi:MAG TPA: ATP-binding protein [Gemmatimonadales bacterium]|nr:ATP-binding protein [Gemmatimonadales bacterium]
MRVANRLLLGLVAALLFALVVVVWASRTAVRKQLTAELEAALAEEARLIQAALPEDPDAWPRMVGRWAALRAHRVTLINSQGLALADNQAPPGVLAREARMSDLPEVRAALAGQVGTTVRAEPGRSPRLWVAIPGSPVVRVASDLTALEEAAGRSQRGIFLGALLALGAGTLLALLAGRSIAVPLRQIADAARQIPAGVAPRFPRFDITEIEQLSRALREMHHQLVDRVEAVQQGRAESSALVDAMVEGVLSSDSRGRIVTANPAARRLLGFPGSQRLPHLRELFRAPAAREMVDASLRGEPVEDYELEIEGRRVLVTGRPLPAGGAVLVLHDVTELRRLEIVRRDFVANVSHELKTPLTSIAGYAETLLTEDPDRATRQQFLKTILTNSQRMQRLVDDQLDLSRIESGRWQPSPTLLDLASVIRDAWQPRAAQAGTDKLGFVVDVGEGAEQLRADPDGFRQILGNLIDNAIRFTPEGGTIRCETIAEDNGVTVAVSDTGIGIPAEHLPRIFERFYRVDPGRSRDEGGTGLGLAIVKHLVEAHGGWVSAESQVGRGTTIRCWFPQRKD